MVFTPMFYFGNVWHAPISGAGLGKPSTKTGKQEQDKGVRSKAKAKPPTRPDGWEDASSSSHKNAGGDTVWHMVQRRKKKSKQ